MVQLRHFLCYLLVNVLYFIQTNAGNNRDARTCVQTPKINYLSDYTNLIKKLRICQRIAQSKGVTDDEGRIYLSYRVPLNKDEDPNELCKCIRTFILQGDWWIGSKHFCYVECDTVTLTLIGTPQKKFVNAVPVYKGKEPIDVIIEFFGIYSNAQVWNDNCLAKPGISKDGRKNVIWTCDYSGSNVPPKDVLCDYMYKSINVGDILANSTTSTCRVEAKKFYFDLVANVK